MSARQLVNWRDVCRFPPEWSSMRWQDGYTFFRVTLVGVRAMRREGIAAENGWYYLGADPDTGLAQGPFRTMTAAWQDAHRRRGRG